MTTPINTYQNELYKRIKSAIRQSGRLTDDVLSYIDSALFLRDTDSLIDFITDETDCERDTLLDLIFSPDETVQADLEPLLESYDFSSKDEVVIENRLFSTQILAPIQLPDNSILATISVPEEITTHYLKRLNIANQLDPQLRMSIENGVSAKRCPVVKVMMRNAGLRPHGHQLLFLRRLFERLEDDHPDYLECLALILKVLGDAKGTEDVYDLLAEQKRSLFRSLKRLDRFETLLSRSNMETLMLQGIRAPHFSRRELVQEMTLIDRICFAVFGKTEIIPEPVEETLRGMKDLMGTNHP
jgi:hypothetical protein